MNEREKLLQQMRKLRSQIDPRILSAVQKLAEAQFGALFGGRGGPPSRAAKVPPPPQILPPTAPGPGDEPIDGRAAALKFLSGKQRRIGPEGVVAPAPVAASIPPPDRIEALSRNETRRLAAEILDNYKAQKKRKAPASPPAPAPAAPQAETPPARGLLGRLFRK